MTVYPAYRARCGGSGNRTQAGSKTFGYDARNRLRTRTDVVRQVTVTPGQSSDELIPGMTDRMVGEFLEYRPYEDMAEFDREIGKYVDAAEVARFRPYETL